MLNVIELDNVQYIFSIQNNITGMSDDEQIPDMDDGDNENPDSGGQQNPDTGGGGQQQPPTTNNNTSTKVGKNYIKGKRSNLQNAVKKAGLQYSSDNKLYKNVKIANNKVTSFSFGDWVNTWLPLDNETHYKEKIDLNYYKCYYLIYFLYYYGMKITKKLDSIETSYGKTIKNSVALYSSKQKNETTYLLDTFVRKDGKYRISDGKTKAEIQNRYEKSKEYIFYSLQRIYWRTLQYYWKDKYPISYNSLSSSWKHFDHTTSYKTGTIFKISAYNSKKEIRWTDLKTRYEKWRDGYRKYAIKDGYKELGKTTRGGWTFDMLRNTKTETFTFYDCSTKKTLTTYENGGGWGEYRSTWHIANTAIFQGYSVQAACALAGQAIQEVPSRGSNPRYVYMNRYGVSDAYNAYNVSFWNYTAHDLDNYLNTTYRQVWGVTRRCAGDGQSYGIRPCPTKMPSVWKSKGLMTTTSLYDFTYYFEAYYEVDGYWINNGTVYPGRLNLSDEVYGQFKKQTGH